MESGTAPRIDCHAHVYTRAMPLAPDAWHHPPADASVAQFLETLQLAGVDYGVLAASSLHGDHNDYALAATRAHRTLRTTVIVSPDIVPAVLEAMGDDGAVGIRLQLRNKPMPDLASAQYRRLFGTLAELGWHVELHDDLNRLPPVLALLGTLGVRIVIDHFARPAALADIGSPDFDAVLDAVGQGRTWVKLSSSFRLPSSAVAVAAFARLTAVGGTERLLWGSDWPFANFEADMDYRQAVADHHRLVPDEAGRAAIDRTGIAFYFPEAGAA